LWHAMEKLRINRKPEEKRLLDGLGVGGRII
jgi:hypothetical protein